MPKKTKILILDDREEYHKQVKEELGKYFGKKGQAYEVKDVFNVKEGLEKYNKFKPDIVFSDIEILSPEELEEADKEAHSHHGHREMKNKDGIYKFLKSIKEKNPEQYVISMSSDKNMDLAIEALKEGANSFIKKSGLKENIPKVLERYEKGNE